MSKPKSKVVEVRVVGPLASYAGQFRVLLAERGYAPLSRVRQLQVMAHLSKWMRSGGLDVGDLTRVRVDEYLGRRLAGNYSSFCTRASLRQLLDVLAGCGAPSAEPDLPGSGVDVLLAGYADYLRSERRLVSSTVAAYALRARRFILGYGHGADLRAAQASDVTGAVLREADRVSTGAVQFFVVALRSFLRYGYLTGLIDADLAGASLPVTGRSRSALPDGISPADSRALLASCDRRTAMGRRDYAVILVLLRLGLRACEVAGLRLDDIDWRAGQITVRGKGQRADVLPLPVDVGEAIVAYLRRARPHADEREVFLRLDAPRAGLGRGGVSLIVRRGCVRAGLAPHGAHRLRHALATEMLRSGASLPEIGQVLRHRDQASTSIYVRVDIDQLRTMARPWTQGAA